MMYDLIVAGGGAAGFFAAIRAAELRPDLKILIVEKSPKLLSKVRVSGGGRCNVTHSCFDPIELASHYPRGAKFLKEIFKRYSVPDVIEWFENKGVELKTEEDGRMFPVRDDSQTIIDCFMREAISHKIKIEISNGVRGVSLRDGIFEIHFQTGPALTTKNLLVAVGGVPAISGYDWISALGLSIVPPVPSLFTLNDREKKFADLMGISVPSAEVKIAGTKFSSRGPVLITHWGLSGPAVIRLSAWAAIYLHGVEYNFTVLVSWAGTSREQDVRSILSDHKKSKGKQRVLNNPLFNLPLRLWVRLCALAEITEEKIWAELPQKNLNKLMEYLIRCPFHIRGKTTFKEEFVTCGGVDLGEVNHATMESRKVKGLYFAGEILNIDGETGGFNFQAAWSTASIAAEAIAGKP
jgi:predicted Rossmann fold flavoprotein